jgi:hypothetical protein
MALRSLAFGPLPRAQVQASQRLAMPSSSSGGAPRTAPPSLGDLGAATPSGGTEGFERVDESFNPVFPDLFAAHQGGDVMDLPGAGGGTDFTSEAVQELSGLDKAPISQDTSGLGGGVQSDITKALQALQQGMKLGKSGKNLLDWLGTSGALSSLSLAPSTVAGLGPNAAATGFAPLTAKGLGEATAGGAAGGTGSGLGAASSGGAALSALLSVLAQATGNPELAQAAKAASVATGGISLANTGAGLAGLATTGATAGAGLAAGAAFSPITAALIASTISGLVGKGDPIGEGIGEMMGTRDITGDYYRFAPDLARNLTNNSQALSTLQQALPYAQTQEELGRLLNTYKNFVGTTNDWELGNQFGESAVDDPYRIGNLPGAGGSAHEGGITADLGPQVNWLQSQVDTLKGALPGPPITGGYGSPGGSLEGADAMRLWTQFLDREQNAPILSRGAAPTSVQSGEGTIETPGVAAGFYGSLQTPDDLRYGQAGYDYAGSGFPEPGQYLGSQSEAYQNLTIDQVLRALMGMGGANGVA